MNRKRVARLVAVAGVAVVVAHFASTLPREVEIRYRVGDDHGDVQEARIAYTSEGEEMKGVRLRYDHGAPPVVHHRVELPPGQYGVEADLRGPSLTRSVRRHLKVPADGVVRIDLGAR
ncbi:MAG: hypothetical protein ACODAU_06335 [Myxococcota bacterium]